MRVLVAGGAGYIGSHVAVAVAEAGHVPVIADDYSNSSPAVIDRLKRIIGSRPEAHRVDLRDAAATEALLARSRPDAVIHLAGLKAVGESVAEPLRYYSDNLTITFSLLKAMAAHGVKTVVFSSSATVYGDKIEPPYRETDGPLNSTSPYGQTKVMIERILEDLSVSDPEWQIGLLRYFNPIGAHPSGLIGEDPQGIPNNLAPFIAQVAVGRRPEIMVFGGDYPTADGTGERDYIHVSDLARGHVAALEHLRPGARVWNLGAGEPTSVLQLIAAFEEAVGRKLPHRVVERRAGDIARFWADPSRAHEELGWKVELGVAEMARDAWNWQSKNPNGYAEA